MARIYLIGQISYTMAHLIDTIHPFLTPYAPHAKCVNLWLISVKQPIGYPSPLPHQIIEL